MLGPPDESISIRTERRYKCVETATWPKSGSMETARWDTSFMEQLATAFVVVS